MVGQTLENPCQPWGLLGSTPTASTIIGKANSSKDPVRRLWTSSFFYLQ
jgi:hypothetical protein